MKGQVLRNCVREKRRELSITIDELAQTSGVSRTVIGAVERDGVAPTMNVALKLAEALGSTVQDLFWSEPADAHPIEAAS